MTRTSRTLKRLGVAGVAIATIGAGVPAFFATAAGAAQANQTNISITPANQTAQVGTCVPYTVTVTPGANGPTGVSDTSFVDVVISQTVAATSANNNPTRAPGGSQNVNGGVSGQNANVVIGFCTPTSGTNVVPAAPDNGAPGQGNTCGSVGNACPESTYSVAGSSNAFSTSEGPTTCYGTRPGNTDPGPNGTASNASGSASCNAEFQLPQQNRNTQSSTFTFGVFSNYAGQQPGTAYVDINDDDVPQFGVERTASFTTTYVSGATPTVSKVTCSPRSGNQPAGSQYFVTCQATGANGSAVTGAKIDSSISQGPDRGQAVTCGQPTFNSAGDTTGTTGSQTTDNTGSITCSFFNQGALGTDTINVFPRGSSNVFDAVTATFTGAARNIICQPKTNTVGAGGGETVTCTVTDVNANPVSGQGVQFNLTGTGRLNQNSNTAYAVTNNSGVATVTVSSFTNETGSATVTATLGTLNQTTGTFTTNSNPNGNTAECQQAKGTTTSNASNANATTTGNCTDSVTVTFTAASPSPSASSTTSPSPSASSTTSPSSSPAPTRQTLVLRINTPTVPAGSRASVTVTGAANQIVQLVCYSRPSTTYNVVRQTAINAAGDPVTFSDLALGRNTRCYAQYATNNTQGAAPSQVISVTTVVSLSAVRTGVRTYTFQGRNLPRAAGQLITLYRVDGNGNEIRTANLTTDASGIYRISRHFTGGGTFSFIARTGATLNNIAGHSNVYSVNIH